MRISLDISLGAFAGLLEGELMYGHVIRISAVPGRSRLRGIDDNDRNDTNTTRSRARGRGSRSLPACNQNRSDSSGTRKEERAKSRACTPGGRWCVLFWRFFAPNKDKLDFALEICF